MTPKQKNFISEYLLDYNATQSAIRAGYSAKSAEFIGFELMQKPEIADAIEQAREERIKRTQARTDALIPELETIGFVNMADFWIIADNGDPVPNYAKFLSDRTLAAAIQSLEIDYYVEGRGENARTVKRLKFKLHNKGEAILNLLKAHGKFVEKLAIKDERQLECENMTDEELRDVINRHYELRLSGLNYDELIAERDYLLAAVEKEMPRAIDRSFVDAISDAKTAASRDAAKALAQARRADHGIEQGRSGASVH